MPVRARAAARALLLAAAVAACADRAETDPEGGAAVPADSADPAPIVDAEHAFADTLALRGWNAGVRAYAAGDGIVLAPGPVNALESLDPEAPPGPSALQWWPAWAGIARSGDLGFTTGPFFFGDRGYVGHYFTVWRREGDGTWRWIFDGGMEVHDEAPPGRDDAVERLPVAAAGVGSASGALHAAETLDLAIAAEATADAATAIVRRLATDGRVNRAFLPRAIGPEAARATLARHARSIRFEPLGGAGSSAGDLAFTYGRARWTDEDGERLGYYARIWQRRAHGWALVFDEIVPHRAPPGS